MNILTTFRLESPTVNDLVSEALSFSVEIDTTCQMP